MRARRQTRWPEEVVTFLVTTTKVLTGSNLEEKRLVLDSLLRGSSLSRGGEEHGNRGRGQLASPF